MIRLILPLGSLALLIFPVASSAEDWTRFRGPGGAGETQALDIPTQWAVADCKWRVELPGVGYSSPVVRANRLFVTSAIQEDGQRIIRCLDTADGQMIWKRDFAAATFDMGKATAYDASSPALRTPAPPSQSFERKCLSGRSVSGARQRASWTFRLPARKLLPGRNETPF
jgi:hypothetical protein